MDGIIYPPLCSFLNLRSVYGFIISKMKGMSMENANGNLTDPRGFGWVPSGARQRRAERLAPGAIWGGKQLEPGWERSCRAPTPARAVPGQWWALWYARGALELVSAISGLHMEAELTPVPGRRERMVAM